MKVFLSHSWHDKMPVQKMINSIKKNGIQVWIDAENLLPGSNIQSTIDKDLQETDLVVLAWSKGAADSRGVAEELRTAQKLGKTIIPCFLDGTRLPESLGDLKGIDCTLLDQGLGQLNMALVNYMNKSYGLANSSAIGGMNEFSGALEIATHLAQKENIKTTGTAEEQGFWGDHIKEKSAIAEQALNNELQITQEVMSLCNQVINGLEGKLDDKNTVLKALQTLENHDHKNHIAMQKVIRHVRSIYSTFDL